MLNRSVRHACVRTVVLKGPKQQSVCRLLLRPLQYNSPVTQRQYIQEFCLFTIYCDSTAAVRLLTQQQGFVIRCTVNATWVYYEVDVMLCAGAVMASSGSGASGATPTDTPIITSSIAGAPSPEPASPEPAIAGVATPGALNTTSPAVATSGRKMLQI